MHVRKDGTVFPASVTLSPIRDADGVIVGASVIARDVTEQKKAFEATQQMAAIVEGSDDAIFASTLKGTITSWNPAAERLFGYTSQEMIGASGRLLSPKDRTDEVKTILAKVGAGQSVENLETERVRKDGTAFPVSLTVSPIRDESGAVVGASAIGRNMTELRRAALYTRGLIEVDPDPLGLISVDGTVLDLNEATVRAVGIPRDELIGTDFSRYWTDPDKAREDVMLTLAKGSVTDFPLTARSRDGTLMDALCNARLYRDINGDVLGVLVAARDVTEQKRAEQAVQQDRDLLRATLDSLMDPHVLLEAVRDEAGQIVDFVYVDANPAACAYNSLDHEHLVGTRLLDLQPGNIAYACSTSTFTSSRPVSPSCRTTSSTPRSPGAARNATTTFARLVSGTGSPTAGGTSLTGMPQPSGWPSLRSTTGCWRRTPPMWSCAWARTGDLSGFLARSATSLAGRHPICLVV
jgi:PAS domain S-box-containing protein